MSKIFKNIILFTFINCFVLSAYELVIGDRSIDSKSFIVPVSANSYYMPSGQFYLGSCQKSKSNNYSICVIDRLNKDILPLTPEKIALNNKADQINPLHGAKIKFISASKNKVFAVKDGDNSIYAIDPKLRRSNVEVFKSKKICDFQGQEVDEIIAISNNCQNRIQDLEQIIYDSDLYVLSQKNNILNLSFLTLKSFKETVKSKEGQIEQNRFHWHIFDSNTGDNGNKSIKIDNSISEINIGQNGVDSILNSSEIYFDPYLEKLYIALNIKTNKNSGSGGLGLLMAGKSGNKLVLQKVASDNIFKNNDKIIGSIKSDVQINIKNIRTMHTTTHLSYLILVRNFGQFDKVYALPLVNNSKIESHGKLAKFDSIPYDIILENSERFQSRAFFKEALNEGDALNFDSLEALVGGSVTLPGQINEIRVLKDSVFVSILNSNSIFYSQPLFDKFGRIKGWTNFKPAISFDYDVFSFAQDSEIGYFVSLSTKDGKSSNIATRSGWTQGNTKLEEVVAKELDKKSHGIMSFFDFSHDKDLIALGGHKKIMFVKFDRNKSSLVNNFKHNILDNEAIKSIINITSLETIKILNKSLLIIGGSNGLVISKEDFSNVKNSDEFQKIGNYKNIRKILAQNNQIYILTDTRLDKIILDSNFINNNDFKIINLAHAKNNEFERVLTFSDFIISGPLVILATSNGLFRSGNLVDIRNAYSNKLIKWDLILLPDSSGTFDDYGPVSRLFCVSPTNREIDMAYGGNIYVLNGYVGYHQLQIYRLSCDLKNNEVSDETISLLPDIFYKNEPTFFTNIGEYRNYIYTDGATITLTRSAYLDEKPFLEILPSRLKSGQAFTPNQAVRLKLSLEKYKSIGHLTRIFSTGNLIVSGDFGIRIHQ